MLAPEDFMPMHKSSLKKRQLTAKSKKFNADFL